MRTLFTAAASSITLLTLAALPLVSADLNVSDLRLGGGILSNDFEGESSTTIVDQGNNITTTRDSTDDRNADNNWRGQLQYVGGQLGAGGGLIWGAGIAVNYATWDNGSQNAHVTTPNIDILLGYGYAFTSNWHFELTPFAGYGRAYYSVTDNGSRHTSNEWDNYVEYGAKIGTYVSLGNSLIIGVEVPYLVGRIDPDYNYNDDNNRQVTVTDNRKNQGFGLLATVGVRF